MICVGISLLIMLGAAQLAMMIASAVINGRRTSCRCCGTQLDRVGGYGVVWCGSGFCRNCMAEILRKI